MHCLVGVSPASLTGLVALSAVSDTVLLNRKIVSGWTLMLGCGDTNVSYPAGILECAREKETRRHPHQSHLLIPFRLIPPHVRPPRTQVLKAKEVPRGVDSTRATSPRRWALPGSAEWRTRSSKEERQERPAACKTDHLVSVLHGVREMAVPVGKGFCHAFRTRVREASWA